MNHNLETYKLFFGSLANPNRLQIINLLRKNQNKKMNVTEICEALNFEQTMVSHNLKRLEKCGMIFVSQDGKFRYYQLNQNSILPIMKLIDGHMSDYCEHVCKHKHKDM